MSIPTVLALDPIHPDGQQQIRSWATLAYDPERKHWRDHAGEAAGLIVRNAIGVDALEQMPKLRAIVRSGAGVDGIDLDYAASRGIRVTNTPGANADSVAEYVFAGLFHAARALHRYDTDLRAGNWGHRTHARLESFQLRGRRLGIVGMGEIGRRVAQIGHFGFGMPVQAFISTARKLPEHVHAVDLQTLCASNDIVVLCCSLTAATRGLIGSRELALLRPDSVLVNVARGAVIDQAALLAFAADPARHTDLVLDVFDQSPLPAGHPLTAAGHALLTPHMAGVNRDSEHGMGLACAAVMQNLLLSRQDQAAAAISGT